MFAGINKRGPSKSGKQKQVAPRPLSILVQEVASTFETILFIYWHTTAVAEGPRTMVRGQRKKYHEKKINTFTRKSQQFSYTYVTCS